MAIFGNFTDMPFPDVLSFVGRGSGCLIVRSDLQQRQFRICIHNGFIRRFFLDATDVTQEETTRSLLLELVQTNEGDFEFINGYDEGGVLNLRVEEILLSTLVAADEIQALQDYFPDPATLFTFSPSGESRVEGGLDESWSMFAPYFNREGGTCAQELANELGLSLNRVLLHLYKLRTINAIVPLRAFEMEIPPEPQTVKLNPIEEEIQEMAGHFKPIWDTAPLDPDADQENTMEDPFVNMRRVKPQKAEHGLILNLMSALSGFLKRT